MDNAHLSSPELLACRVCLEIDAKLINLQSHRLVETFAEVTGTSIMSTDGLPQHICSICLTLLQKFAKFRTKCQTTHVFLQNHYLQFRHITVDFIRGLETSHLKLPLIESEMQTIYFSGEITEDFIKQEMHSDFITDNNFIGIITQDKVNDINYNNDYCDYDNTEVNRLNDIDEKSEVNNESYEISDVQNGEENEISDIKIFANEVKIEVKKKTLIKKRKKRKFNSVDIDAQKVRDFLFKKSDTAQGDLNKLFYDYIIKKYIDKIKPISRGKLDIMETDSMKDNKSDGDINTICNNIINSNNEQKSKKTFYKHIRDKYVNKNEKPDSVTVDVARLRMRKIKNSLKYTSLEEKGELASSFNATFVRLNKEQQLRDLEMRKESAKFLYCQYKCTLCFLAFKTEDKFDRHMKGHDPSAGDHECDICHLRFRLKSKCNKHVLSHKFKYTCKLCKKISRNSTAAKAHFNNHEGVIYKCEYCGKIFRKSASRVNHIRIHHGDTRCEICHDRFAGRVGLSAHKARAHQDVYKCAWCQVTFNEADALILHLNTGSDGACDTSLRPCAKCGEGFPTEEQLSDHIQIAHIKRNQTKKEKHPKDRRRPYNRKKTKKRIPDPDQDVEASFGSDVNERTEKQKLLRSVMCEMCGTTLGNESALRYHQRIHTGERPFSCTECPKTFRLKELQQMHLRTHTGDRPYKCSLCPKKFKSASANYRHQLVHTKERRHRCPVCEKLFLTSTCVKLHVRSVHMRLPAPPRLRARARPDGHGRPDL